MPDRAEAQAAIENLNGKDLLGKQMREMAIEDYGLG